MIKLDTPNSRAINTGNNIDKPASTFLQNGPRDELASVDAYSGSPTVPVDANSISDASNTASQGAQEIKDAAGKKIVDPRYEQVANRSKALGKKALSVSGENLWTAILCGAFDERGDTPQQQQARVENAAIWLRSTGCSAENLMGLLSVKDGKFSLDQSVLDDRISSALGESIHTLDPAMKEELRGAYFDLTGQDLNALMVEVDGKQTAVSSDQYEETNTFIKLLRKVPGAEDSVYLLDLHAETIVIGGILDRAIELGIPDAVETVLKKIDDDQVRKRVLLSRVRSAAIASNLKVVREAIETNGREVVTARVPDLVTLVLKHYRYPDPGTRVNYPTYRNELLRTLEAIHPAWYRTERAGESVSYLGPFTEASEEALTLLSDTPYAVQALMARNYPERDQKQVAGRYHPYVYL